jgi:FAD/FMN-containing dehydrogenase
VARRRERHAASHARGGAAATNIHGKNNFRAGPIGDHILDFSLRTPGGAMLECSRSENADVFHAAIAGLGMLGVITRIRVRMKRVESGLLGVDAIATGDLAESFDAFEEHLPTADYLVGWLDAMPRGTRRGRGVLHAARPGGSAPHGPRPALARRGVSPRPHSAPSGSRSRGSRK